jgi:toxin-antitoxin system PIN domain toxin
MKPYLLDTNVLIALAWPNHVHHAETTDWFLRKAAPGFRTCPITETGFVRISSNPSFTANAVGPAEALALLDRITRLPGHGFWPDDLPVAQALASWPVLCSHRQVTDGYLLALAAGRDGVLATLDRGIAPLARKYQEHLELIGASS